MATVTLTFTDKEDGSVDVDKKTSNIAEEEITYANFHAYAFEQYREKIWWLAAQLNHAYQEGIKHGTR